MDHDPDLAIADDQLVVAAADKLEAQLPLETLWVMPTQTDLNANHTFSFISPEKRLLVFAETNAIMDGFVTKVYISVVLNTNYLIIG